MPSGAGLVAFAFISARRPSGTTETGWHRPIVQQGWMKRAAWPLVFGE